METFDTRKAMNFDEIKTSSSSTIELLLNQVKEQSDLCDMTIKLKTWEKRFHWCVLVASPYFDCIRKHGFLERESGVVSMQVGTSVSLEEAILFLYGKKPKINSDNITDLMEIAEYLIIPELKAECVRWIKRTKVTEDNCMTMVKLSSLYDFFLSSCEEYMEGHIIEMMLKDEMLSITPESVLYLLQDPRLSYVGIQDKFSFLVRWTKSQMKRKGEFERLLQCLNFEDSEADFIQNVVLREPLVHEACSPSFIAELRSIDSLSTHDVLLFPNLYQDGILKCFDITRRRWCSVSVDTVEPVPDGFYKQMVKSIEGVQGRLHSNVYMFKNTYIDSRTQRSICILNLETNIVKKSKIKVKTGNDGDILKLTEQYIHDHELVLVSKKLVEYEKLGSDDLPQLTPIDRMTACAKINSRLAIKKNFSVSVLYVGQIEDETTELTAILCLRREISKVCSNGTTIAMLSKDAAELYLFNKIDYSLDELSIKNIYNSITMNMSMMSTSGSGFVVYDKKCCINVVKQIGPCLSRKWLTSKSSFCSIKDEERYTERYLCCENKWFRYKRSYPGSRLSCISYTSHEKLRAHQSQAVGDKSSQVELWESIPINQAGYVSPPSNVFQISLPTRKLSCALNCPHCKQRSQNDRGYLYYDHSENSYSDDDVNSYEDLSYGYHAFRPYYDSDAQFDSD